jgi:hypothetical protein
MIYFHCGGLDVLPKPPKKCQKTRKNQVFVEGLAIVLRDMKQYGYPLVNTVGFNEGDIRRYIQNQEENDRLEDEEKSGDKSNPFEGNE